MQVADLYIRVSTDEQTKGYSPRSQEAVLRDYCYAKDIEVRYVVFEDYTAKHFDRPEWKRLMALLRRQQNQSNLLLFTKWDRFSRNASDAYQMIGTLKKLGIEPQAIEQPLDLSVPENKMMLAIYLTAPEIENDRRGLNTKAGIRQARKEGRHTGKAVRGYINKTAENGRKYIAINEPDATYMRWAFEQVGDGIYSCESILNRAREKGLRIDKNTFMLNLRNPIYCGLIKVAEHNDDPEHLVRGQHEPLISEELFWRVQRVMNSRKRASHGTSIATPKELILRGFLKCNKCPRNLTGSASKGNRAYTVYYHCRSGCGVRHRALDVNAAFIYELMQYIPRPGYPQLFVKSIVDAYNDQVAENKRYVFQIREKIAESNQKIERARELMLDGEITPAEHRKVKEEVGSTVVSLESHLRSLNVQKSTPNQVKNLAEKAVRLLCELDKLFEICSIEAKRLLIGTFFPEKLTFSEGRCRTLKVNRVAELIYLKNKELRAKKAAKNFLKSL